MGWENDQTGVLSRWGGREHSRVLEGNARKGGRKTEAQKFEGKERGVEEEGGNQREVESMHGKRDRRKRQHRC
jgi:hypothetical protein